MDGLTDTIVAPITGMQRAPVALIRISGPLAPDIASRLMPSSGSEPRHAYFGEIFIQGEAVDEGYVTQFEEGKSYTGEQSAEISCHGSPQLARKIVAEIVSLGARPARPGEFTERAFLNGRIDLTRAEAVRETIDADTDAQRRRALALRQGALAHRVSTIQDAVAAELAKVEASVDFSEEVGELDRPSTREALGRCIFAIDELLAGYRPSRLIREGLRVAIVGRPNVGKSSLLNALLGMNRAIVTDLPGTTRDTIEESLSIGGYPVVLTDTAGIRDSDEQIEQIGVARSRAAVEAADQVWFVFEANRGWTTEDEALFKSLARGPDLVIANKSDLGNAKGPSGAVVVSAVKGSGLDWIQEHVMKTFGDGGDLPLINERVAPDLEEARGRIVLARGTLADDLPADLACVDLYGALHALGRITGETAPDEIIERVFRDFCIGK